ncbi:unnamed protein product [Ectocarpus sp. 6 AP-2014]
MVIFAGCTRKKHVPFSAQYLLDPHQSVLLARTSSVVAYCVRFLETFNCSGQSSRALCSSREGQDRFATAAKYPSSLPPYQRQPSLYHGKRGPRTVPQPT